MQRIIKIFGGSLHKIPGTSHTGVYDVFVGQTEVPLVLYWWDIPPWTAPEMFDTMEKYNILAV